MYHRKTDFDPSCVEKEAPGGDPCVVFNHVTISCPAENDTPNRQVLKQEGEYPLIRCRVCDLQVSPDTDMRLEYWSGTVSWGPNQFDAIISETSIGSYWVYLADDRLRKLGNSLIRVEARLWANLFKTEICDSGYYQAQLNLTLPAGTAYFMVVPFTRGGVELNIGPVKRIHDLGTVAADSAMRPAVGTLRGAVATVALAIMQTSLWQA